MELKDFIKTSVQSIIDACKELIDENQTRTLINPASNAGPSGDDNLQYANAFRAVTNVSFDIAVTEGTEKEAGGGAKIKIAAVSIGGDGRAAATSSNVSRIGFSLRVAMPATAGPALDQRFPGPPDV